MSRKKINRIYTLEQIIRWSMWGTVLILLIILNYWYGHKYLSSNATYITEYQEKEDALAQYRHPAVAGIFYAASAEKLSKEVDNYLQTGRFSQQTKNTPKILVVPHAGYAFSAGTAGKAYALLQQNAKKIKNILLVGPSHNHAGNDIYMADIDYFVTPMGNVAVNKDIVHQLADNNEIFKVNNRAHLKEHSLEVQLPFIQKVLPQAKIVPILYGDIPYEQLAKGIEPYFKKENTILIVSADLSHYHNAKEATQIDNQTAQKIEKGEEIENHESCGAIGINAALILAKKNNYAPQMLELVNSGDINGDKSSVVGYGAWGFYPDSKISKPMKKMEKEVQSLKEFATAYQKELLQIAQTALEKAVHQKRHYSPSRRTFSEDIFDKGATFVTLYKQGDLRGCIGSIVPTLSVAQNIADNTFSAALEDNRFSEVTPEELPQITYTISLLSNVEKIDYYNERDLLRKIKTGQDGVIIQDGNRQGVFLPVVWKEISDKEEFFKQLKIKAGMSPSYWNNQINVYRFRTVEIANEN